MKYSKHEVIKVLNSKTLPLDLVYECYTEEAQKRNFKVHSPHTFEGAINQFLMITGLDLTEYLIKRFDINRIEDKQGNIIKLY